MLQILELIAWVVIFAFLTFYVGSIVWGVVQDLGGKRGFDQPPRILIWSYYTASFGFVIAVAIWVAISLWDHLTAWLK